jgi:transcriptional regulator with XRE-family HTH domain
MSGESIGRRVRRLRKQRGLSQTELAQALRITPQQLNNLETGEQRTMRDETLARYAAVLGVTDQYLATGIQVPVDNGDLPDLEVYLRQSTQLAEDDITQIARIVRSLENEQRLARLLREQVGREPVL